MNKYISDPSYNYENKDFYFKINDEDFLENVSKPFKINLYGFLFYFKFHYPKSDLFKIYMSGKFNSSDISNSNYINLIVTYNDITNKNYEDIYDCLYFINNFGIKKYYVPIKPTYVDNITIKHKYNISQYELGVDINSNNIDNYKDLLKDKFKEYQNNLGETIQTIQTTIYKNINASKLKLFNRTLNLECFTEMIVNSKKIYIYKNESNDNHAYDEFKNKINVTFYDILLIYDGSLNISPPNVAPEDNVHPWQDVTDINSSFIE